MKEETLKQANYIMGQLNKMRDLEKRIEDASGYDLFMRIYDGKGSEEVFIRGSGIISVGNQQIVQDALKQAIHNTIYNLEANLAGL